MRPGCATPSRNIGHERLPSRIGAERDGHFDNLFEAIEVLPVHERIHRYTANPALADQACGYSFGLLRTREPGNAVAGGAVGILKLSWTCSSPASTSSFNRPASRWMPEVIRLP